MTESTDYVELHARSAFSFLDGASQPEALIERAVELEMPALALTDRNGLYGAARFHSAAKNCVSKANVQSQIKAHIAPRSLFLPSATNCSYQNGFPTSTLTSHPASPYSALHRLAIRIFAS